MKAERDGSLSHGLYLDYQLMLLDLKVEKLMVKQDLKLKKISPSVIKVLGKQLFSTNGSKQRFARIN